MKRHLFWLFMLVLLVPFCMAISVENKEEDGRLGREEERWITPLTYLLTNEKNFPEQQPVRIEGFLSFEAEEILLYFARDDYLYGNRENALLIAPEWMDDAIKWALEFNIVPWKKEEELHGQHMGIDIGADQTMPVRSISREEGNGCVAQIVGHYGLHDLSWMEEFIERSWEQREVVTLLDPEGGVWKDSFGYGEGGTLEQALPVSIYRYMWDNFPYRGKYIEVCGKVQSRVDEIMAPLSVTVTGINALCFSVTSTEPYISLGGSLLLGYDHAVDTIHGYNIAEPVLNPAYRDVGVVLRGRLKEHWPAVIQEENERYVVSECYMKLQPKRGEMEE